ACCHLDLSSCPTRRSSDLNAEIRLEVAVSHHAFVGIEVDKNHRPVSEQPDFGNDGSLQRHVDGAYPHVLECEPGMRDLVLRWWRSEEHTSELQSRENLVCR